MAKEIEVVNSLDLVGIPVTAPVSQALLPLGESCPFDYQDKFSGH